MLSNLGENAYSSPKSKTRFSKSSAGSTSNSDIDIIIEKKTRALGGKVTANKGRFTTV